VKIKFVVFLHGVVPLGVARKNTWYIVMKAGEKKNGKERKDKGEQGI